MDARTRVGGIGVLVVVLSASQAAAQGTAALQQQLETARALDCTFSLITTGTWKDGAPSADSKPTTLKMGFSDISVDDGSAKADGGYGAAPVVVRYVSDYMHLMQMYKAGPLYTTTVFARAAKAGRLLAVHTRHEFVDVSLPGFTSRPEMYMGDCGVAR